MKFHLDEAWDPAYTLAFHTNIEIARGLPFSYQDLMNNDAKSDVANVDGTPRGGLGRTVTLQNNTSMGEQSADIVVGALRKVRL